MTHELQKHWTGTHLRSRIVFVLKRAYYKLKITWGDDIDKPEMALLSLRLTVGRSCWVMLVRLTDGWVGVGNVDIGGWSFVYWWYWRRDETVPEGLGLFGWGYRFRVVRAGVLVHKIPFFTSIHAAGWNNEKNKTVKLPAVFFPAMSREEVWNIHSCKMCSLFVISWEAFVSSIFVLHSK